MNTKIISLSLIASCVLLVGCTAKTETNAPSPSSMGETSSLTTNVKKDASSMYTTSTYKFSLKLPTEWDVVEYTQVPSDTSVKYFKVVDFVDVPNQNRKVGTLTAYVRQENRTPAEIEKIISSEKPNVYREPLFLTSDKKRTTPNKLTVYSRDNVLCKPLICDKYLVETPDYLLSIESYKSDLTQDKNANSNHTANFIKIIDSIKKQ